MASNQWASPADRLSQAFDRYFDEARRDKSLQLSTESRSYGPDRYTTKRAEAARANVASLYQMQEVLRPLFGKPSVRQPDIGDHPDFEHLKGTEDTTYCPITTMFMDIEGSTRLGIIFTPQEVFRIKNAFIRAGIEVITSFDGHVHRIMGDAVMAYFGGCHGKPETAAIDALNCAAVLRAMVERVVVPRLNQIRPDHQFGIRIGLDFGPKDSVLWSSYGYPSSDEVTATSFFVDVASKLQHSAGRNRIMIGDSLRGFIDVPNEFLSVKKGNQQGREVDETYVSPNHTDAKGHPINYRQYIFDGDSYLRVGPIAQKEPKLIGDGDLALSVMGEVFAKKNGDSEAAYHPCTGPVAKDKWIRFTLRMPYMPRLPYTIRCTVENHGTEAELMGGENRGNHSESYTISTESQHQNFCHWEHTSFRGLHYMIIQAFCHGGCRRACFGVWVE